MPKARRAGEETQSWAARDLEARPPRLRNLVVRATQRTAERANQQALCWEAPGGGRLLGGVPETYEADWSELEAAPVLTFRSCAEGRGLGRATLVGDRSWCRGT